MACPSCLHVITPREAAYLALLASLRQEKFIQQSLEEWQRMASPTSLDYAFAYDIAAGSARMALALDHVIKKMSTKQKTHFKLKEKALIRTAIYQHYFMDRVPAYAIANESVKLAKKYCHSTFANFLNALLRRLADEAPSLPEGNDPLSLSIRHSYPLFFVEQLLSNYSLEKTITILTAGNLAPVVMARVRTACPIGEDVELFSSSPKIICIRDKATLRRVAASPDYYIQNSTPATLIEELAQQTKPPQSILDLCASPGGKLLAAHDHFPKAHLFANDVSEEKMARLKENLVKYGVQADVSCGDGEKYPRDKKFDLIILDVPCSNSGVLNKRPEARWRLSQEALEQLQAIQKKLIAHAASLLAPNGAIWYMTCSILGSENEGLIGNVCRQLNLEASHLRTVLPDMQGRDGGFACQIKLIA